MSDQREAILSNAKYLRNVRPIDPEEIREYVAGQPHPGVVARTLRESAVELGLVEREDGTFVPVDDAPVTATPGTVERFPAGYEDALLDLLVEAYGPDWHEGESGDRLRETIRRLKDAYYRQASVEYDAVAALGYAVYHLPDYYAAVQYALADLTEAGLVPRDLRVLDVGAGVGGPALGLHDLLPADALVDYHAVEPSAAADVLDAMLAETGRNFHPTVHRTTVESFDFPGEYDLVLFGNVLSELDDPVAAVESAVDALAPDGSVLALSPADRNTAIGLRETERTVERERDVTVFSPAVRLWPDETPSDTGWSFDVRQDLAVPAVQRRLDEAASGPDHDPGEFVNVDVQFAYSILRTDGRRRVEFSPDPDRFAKMAEMERHLTERIDLAAVKLSRDLAGEDANPLFRVGDGSEQRDHFAVLTRESALNADLRTADYGDLLVFEGALALWNDDEDAYNLVVDEETVVDRVPV